MKKLVSIILPLFLVVFATFSLAGCSADQYASITYTDAKKVEIVNADEAIDQISAKDNTVDVKASKQGTYEVNVVVDGKEEVLTVTRTKDDYEVSSSVSEVEVSTGAQVDVSFGK